MIVRTSSTGLNYTRQLLLYGILQQDVKGNPRRVSQFVPHTTVLLQKR
jgi:hypothetical protein